MILKGKGERNGMSGQEAAQKAALSPVIKTSPLDMMPILSLRDFRCASRSKARLKLHVFSKRHPPLPPKETIKSYSSLSTLPYETPRAKPSAQQYLLQKGGPLPKNIERQSTKREAQPVKEKKEFRLIREIKMEKAMRAQEKAMRAQEKAMRAQEKGEKANLLRSQYQMEPINIQRNKHSKIHQFAAEIKQILETPPMNTPQHSKIQQINGNKAAQSKDAGLRQFSPKHTRQQSIVDVFLPEEQTSNKEQSVVGPAIGQYFAIERRYEDESYKVPDLGRSAYKASKMLKQRKDSNSSIDLTLRQSKVRAEISISLALQSKKGSKINLPAFYKQLQVSEKQEKVGCLEKLEAHLQILQSMSAFVYQSVKFDEIGEEWQQLNFLIYKKYYIERRKVLHFLQKYPMKNPFCIYNAEISSKEIIQFMKTQQGSRALQQLQQDTTLVKQNLAAIYSKFDKGKVGEKINLHEYDLFSHWIIEELWAELILTQHNTNHQKEVISVRLCRILQLIFLISELSGKFEFSFGEAETAIEDKHYQAYVKEGKDIFQRYILYKSKEDSESFL